MLFACCFHHPKDVAILWYELVSWMKLLAKINQYETYDIHFDFVHKAMEPH
jgi:hypothetical protein